MRVVGHCVSSIRPVRRFWRAGPGLRNPLFSDELTIPWQKEGAKLKAVGWVAAIVTVAAILAANGWPRLAVAASAVQAIATGLVLAAALPGRRWVGAAVGAALLAGVAAGGAVSPWWARQVPAGLAHAMLYGALAAWFGGSLLPGRHAVVTGIARRLNRRFHDGMIPYTRGVTTLWCALALGQLLASAGLLAAHRWVGWAILVDGGHLVADAAVAAGEFAARCWMFPGERTGFWETVRGVRRR